MGTQQLLLIILGVILIGIAMAVGLNLFIANAVESNRDEIIHDLNNIAQYAYQYKIRPQSLGGGNRSYAGLTTGTLPVKLKSNVNATYTIEGAGDATGITIRGTSITGNGYIDAVLDVNGVPTMNITNFNN